MCVKLRPPHPQDSARNSETEITGWTWLLMSIAVSQPWRRQPALHTTTTAANRAARRPRQIEEKH